MERLLRPHRPAIYFCLESVWELDLLGSLFGCFEVCFAVLPVPSPRRVAPYSAFIQAMYYNGGQNFLSENFVNARKWKSMILSEHALKGNGDKRIKEFLSTLESGTSWLDIRVWGWQSRGGRECEEQFNIFWGFSVTPPISDSFACHVSLKVKYFGKVENV